VENSAEIALETEVLPEPVPPAIPIKIILLIIISKWEWK
jgi:hypothetical protein